LSRLVLGVDPGNARCGWGLVAEEEGRLSMVACGCLSTPSTMGRVQRLLRIHQGLAEILQHHRPDEVAVEQLFFNRNVTSAMAVGEARGIALLAAGQHDLPVAEYTPSRVKEALTGSGRATKQDGHDLGPGAPASARRRLGCPGHRLDPRLPSTTEPDVIAHLRGRIAHCGPGSLVVDVAGVGYAVAVPDPLAETSELGAEVALSTHLAVREGEMSLYGFATLQEREIFRLLIGITGVGPRLALKVLSALSPASLARAILEEDVKTLTRIPGVGPRTARRLMLELSEKIAALAPGLPEHPTDGQEEAEAILVSLGCTRQEARQAVRQARESGGPGASVENLVMAAMQVLGQK